MRRRLVFNRSQCKWISKFLAMFSPLKRVSSGRLPLIENFFFAEPTFSVEMSIAKLQRTLYNRFFIAINLRLAIFARTRGKQLKRQCTTFCRDFLSFLGKIQDICNFIGIFKIFRNLCKFGGSFGFARECSKFWECSSYKETKQT